MNGDWKHCGAPLKLAHLVQGGSENSQTSPTTTNTTSIRQLPGAADAQTAHHATSSTAPAHQPLGSANAETTPAGAPAAAADRKLRPDATCPVKKQQPDGMSHRGGGGGFAAGLAACAMLCRGQGAGGGCVEALCHGMYTAQGHWNRGSQMFICPAHSLHNCGLCGLILVHSCGNHNTNCLGLVVTCSL